MRKGDDNAEFCICTQTRKFARIIKSKRLRFQRVHEYIIRKNVLFKAQTENIPHPLQQSAFIFIYYSGLLRRYWFNDIDGLMQDYSNSNALTMELLQSCMKPSISWFIVREVALDDKGNDPCQSTTQRKKAS